MHLGVFMGNNPPTNCNILILGESHHHTESSDLNYTTENIVKDYFRNPAHPAYRFFDKIAACFGYVAEEREIFWNKVWFGNYIEEADCGVKTVRAKKLAEENSKIYNKSLFEFVNQNEIDILCCFSRLVYAHLPEQTSFEEKSISFAVPKTGGKRDWIDKMIYEPGPRANGDIALDKSLTVYGFRHPSARCGFRSENYKNYLQAELRLQPLFSPSGLLK